MKSGQWLFLDGIQCQRGHHAVISSHDLAVLTYTTTTKAGSAFLNITMSETNVTNRHIACHFQHLYVPNHFETLQFHRFESVDPCLFLCDLDLLIHRVDAFQIRQ